MRFTGGERCWNGPARSMTVKLECGVANELKDISEPSVCEYTGTLVTPAACDLIHAQGLNMDLLDQVDAESAGLQAEAIDGAGQL